MLRDRQDRPAGAPERTVPGEEPGIAAVAEWLALRGATEIPHPGGTLLAHLERVHALLGQWGARPEAVAGWSPVTTIVETPASVRAVTAADTPSRSGSVNAGRPREVQVAFGGVPVGGDVAEAAAGEADDAQPRTRQPGQRGRCLARVRGA
jgi:hypothetical protein